MSTRQPVDKILLATIGILSIGGLFIFISASLGLFASDTGATFSDVAINQIVLGFGGGLIAFFIGLTVPYRFWRKYAFHLFLISLCVTLLVYIPHVGLTLNGARRWIAVGPITFQPSELLKIGYILYLAAWFSNTKSKVGDYRFGLIPFCIITGLTAIAVLFQPDTDTFLVMALSGFAMYFVAGAKWKHIFALALLAVLGLGLLVSQRDYLQDRLATFLNPGSDPQGTSYQLQQSLLAVGAGEVFGRGFGQSVQKFGKLPEPISDSIFSVFAEEFGFIGSFILIMAFVTFSLRGLWIAARSPDLFGGLLAVGIVTGIISQSFLNIAAMIGIVPLSGLPLVFVSHGGTALLIAMGTAGLLLSVSRYIKT